MVGGLETGSSFNPRTPAGCDLGGSFVSLEDTLVSIHAPLRGATPSSTSKPIGATKFQSTHPCGVRLDQERNGPSLWCVSIHAPLRGATRMMESGEDYTDCFNPRTPAGCDLSCWVLDYRRRTFQSTHPCGVRRRCTVEYNVVAMFQSTHPCGVRPNYYWHNY